MQIRRVRIQNYRSYASAELNLADRGLVLIEGENRDQGGSNGAGKSSLLTAITWAIYGYLGMAATKTDDVESVIRSGHRDTEVEVDIDLDGKTVTVCRYRKHSKHKNNFFVTVDGKDISAATAADTRTRLIRILKLDFGAWHNVVMFPQRKEPLARLVNADQQDILSDIMRLDRFNGALSRATEFRLGKYSGLQSLDTQLKMLEQERASALDSYERLRARQADEKEAREEQLRLAKAKQKAVEAEEPKIPPNAKQRVADARRQLADSKRPEMERVIAKLRRDISEARGSMRANEARMELYQQQVQSQKDPEEELNQHRSCPSCGQDLPEAAREALRASILERFQEREAENNQRLRHIHYADNENGLLATKLQEFERGLNEASQALEDTGGLAAELKTAEHELQVAELKHSEWETRLKGLKTLVCEYDHAGWLLDEAANEAKQRLKAVEEMIQDRRAKHLSCKTEYEQVVFWSRGFSNNGLPAMVLEAAMPYVNQRANIYMAALSGGQASMCLEMSQIEERVIRRVQFSVHYPNAGSNYGCRSGGEARRADLALQFALGDLAALQATAPVELRLLDEPFEGLDALGCEQMVALLQQHVVPLARTVLVMTHSEAMKSLFEKRILVVKEKGVSRIVEGAE